MPKKPKWNESACPECKEPVAVDATRCPHCQAVYSSGVVHARKEAHATGQKWGLGCVAIIGVLLLAMCTFGGDDADEGSNDSAVMGPAPEPGSASAEVTSAVQKLNDDIMAAVRPCDQAGETLATVAAGLETGQSSIYEGYTAASNLETSCQQSWSLVSDIDVPAALSGAAEAKAEETIETCENAMIAKQMGGEAMKEVFDGDMRPSKVSEATDSAQAAQAGTIACVAGIFATAAAAGAELETSE